jgi:hypothetical protein
MFLNCQQHPRGVLSLAFGIRGIQMRSSSWVHFRSIDHFVTHRTASLFLEPSSLNAPCLAPGLPPFLPTHFPQKHLFVVENYTFTNCVSFLTPSIFPHRDRLRMISWVNHAIMQLVIGAAFRQRFWCKLH